MEKIIKRWQDADKFFKSKGLKRLVCKFRNLTIGGRVFSEVRRDWKRRSIAWFSNKTWLNEFYHDMGSPGIWFHGYLPIDKAPSYAKTEDDFENESLNGYGQYNFKFETVEQLEEFMPLFFEAADGLEREIQKLKKK
jgi:hypothetical protein